MPDVLLIKTSSMGDVLHNLPVVSDICSHVKHAKIDWVVEESFLALPALHPKVKRVLPVALRRWRGAWWNSREEIGAALRLLRSRRYGYALDTQGLLKSALITACIPAVRCGYDWHSARESLASVFYDRTFAVDKNQHAVERNRQLAGLSLGYTPQGEPDYGIVTPADVELPWLPTEPYAVLLHATSRDNKLWREANWTALGNELQAADLRCVLPWGNQQEKARAERLSASIPNAVCTPRLSLTEAAAMLGRASAVVGVDTGFSHLAAALGVPTVGIYTATDPGLTGLYAGQNAVNLGGKNAPPSVADVQTALAQLAAHA